jgi:hypothetical protein
LVHEGGVGDVEDDVLDPGDGLLGQSQVAADDAVPGRCRR